MTIHASKGLEWKAVFIVGCEKGYLPYEEEGRVSDPEEERRLLYVGMTRAKDSLFLSFSDNRMIYGQRKKREMSPFLGDIDVKVRSPFKARAPEAEQLSLL